MFYHFKSTQLFIFAQKCRHSCSKTSFGVRPMLDCRNATSVDNNKSICMSEMRIVRNFGKFSIQMCSHIVMKTSRAGIVIGTKKKLIE